MPSVADQLKAERERQGRTVHDVANVTNIKTDHIRALMGNQKIIISVAMKEDVPGDGRCPGSDGTDQTTGDLLADPASTSTPGDAPPTTTE